ncbi:hypothetical protein HON58_00690, partial [Candidatus Peregrinibacteria bacterium]|nr:hypothetical protein [Candidatus Peregrinibacteria bacterium]
HHRSHCCEQISDRGVGRLVMLAGKHDYEGGAKYLEEHGVDVSLINNDVFRSVASVLAYGFDFNNRSVQKGKGKNALLRKIAKKQYEMSLTLPPIQEKDIIAIREQLGIDIIRLGNPF